MLQSHAHQPRGSRQPHGVPQRHLREAVSGTVRTPGALALDAPRRQRKLAEAAQRQRNFERPQWAESSHWRQYGETVGRRRSVHVRRLLPG